MEQFTFDHLIFQCTSCKREWEVSLGMGKTESGVVCSKYDNRNMRRIDSGVEEKSTRRRGQIPETIRSLSRRGRAQARWPERLAEMLCEFRPLPNEPER